MIKAIAHITVKPDPEKAVMYRIIPSAEVVKRNKSGVCTPAVITFSVYKIEGGKQTQLVYDNSGVKMRVKKSNNASWDNSVNWTTASFPIDSLAEYIDAQLFVNNATWLEKDMLDSVRVPVVSDGTDGEDGEDGEAAVQYWLESTDPIIHYDTNKVTNTSSFIVTCKKKVGSGLAVNCSDFLLYVDFYDGSWIGQFPLLPSSSVTINTKKSYTRYRVRAVNGSAEICRINIEAVFDGNIGPAGAKGAIYLCRGEWNNQETYIKTDDVVHYVIYEGYAYEPKKASVTGGNNPLADVQAGGANWKSLGRYDVIATRVLLANFALIAGAVFWNNKLMSQYGTNNSGATVKDYTNYSEDANGNETGAFHPNLIMDFLNGQIRLSRGKIELKKDGSGCLADGKLTWDSVGNLQIINGKLSISNGKILLNPDGSGQLANGNVTWDVNGNVSINGKFQSSQNGDRIIIDPSSKKIQMINANNKVVVDMAFYNDSSAGSSANVNLYNYDTNGNQTGYTQMFGGRVIINKNGDIFDFGVDTNGKIMWLMDPSRLPTSGTYYGQVYRNGSNLCIRTN